MRHNDNDNNDNVININKLEFNVQQTLKQISGLLDEIRVHHNYNNNNIKQIEQLTHQFSIALNVFEQVEDNDNENEIIMKQQVDKSCLLLLSLVDYTNVACLLELFVRVFVLIPIDVHLVHTRDVPKMIAGRLPRWNWEYMDTTDSVLRVISHCDDSNNIAKSISKALGVVASICLTNRFRPMLLPRHMVDIYIGLLFVDSYSCECPLMEKFLYNFEKNDKKNMFGETIFMDTRSTAVVLRTLLARCSALKSPNIQRVKCRAVTMLTRLAVTDIDSILETFVPTKNEQPGVSYSMEAAAARLADTLAGAPLDAQVSICKEVCTLININVDGCVCVHFYSVRLNLRISQIAAYSLHTVVN